MDLPPVTFGAHLIDILFKVGPSTAGEVISFQEIAAWSHQTGVILDPWESETLRRLSSEHLAEQDAARNRQRPPPSGKVNRAPAPIVVDMIKAMMGQYEAAPGQGPKQPEQPQRVTKRRPRA